MGSFKFLKFSQKRVKSTLGAVRSDLGRCPKARERSTQRGELLQLKQKTSAVHAGTMERRTAALFFR